MLPYNFFKMKVKIIYLYIIGARTKASVRLYDFFSRRQNLIPRINR